MALNRVPMSQFLVKKGFLKQEQLDEAIKVQNQTKNADLARVLIELGMVGEREVLEAKAQEIGVPFVDLDRVTIESSAINVVPERIAKNHNVIPVRKDGMNLYLAMSNTNNIEAADDVRMVTGCRVLPVMAVPGAIEDAIKKHYSSSSAPTNGDVNTGSAVEQVSGTLSTASSATFNSDIRSAIAGAQIARGRESDEDVPDAEAEKMAEQAPIIRLANALIQQAVYDRASDIHVEPQQRSVRVRYRVDGVLMEAMTVPRNLMAPLISRLKIMADMNIAERRIPQDGRIEVTHQGKEYDLRVSSIPTPYGEKIVMRILDKTSVMIGMQKLGFSDETLLKLEELVTQPNGMVLSTGPTGSGKTTTQYSVLNKLNSIGVNILTIEDPIEYQLSGIAQVQVNKKAGLTFGTALRAFLRQDPDIIMVGEMRDYETAEIAIESALTGHLVLSTLHTNDAPSATIRMVDMGVEPYLISATVIGVLAQRLARRLCPDCKEAYEITEMDLRKFGMQVVDPDRVLTIHRKVGCENCRQTGYRGRTGIYEMMTMNAELAELITRRAPLGDVKEAAKANGMKELREDGLYKVLLGATDPDEIMRVVFTAGF
jgi:type IV pilus assembly protein PilB